MRVDASFSFKSLIEISCCWTWLVGPSRTKHRTSPGWKMLDLFDLKVLTLHGFYIHNCWRDWGVSQCWNCCFFKSLDLGNLRDVWSSTAGGNLWVTKPRSSADWLVWSIWTRQATNIARHMVWGNSFLWNLSALDQFEIFRFYSLHWFVFLIVSQTPLYLCHTWFLKKYIRLKRSNQHTEAPGSTRWSRFLGSFLQLEGFITFLGSMHGIFT